VNLSHRIQVKGDEMDAIPSNQERWDLEERGEKKNGFAAMLHGS
jgi:hypothetical protein